jgi:hypothetical protein
MVCKCWFQRLQKDIRENEGPQVILTEELHTLILQHLGKHDVPPDKTKELIPQIQLGPDSSYAETSTEKLDVMVIYLTSTFSPNTHPQYQESEAYVHESHKQFTQSPFSSVPIY